LILANVTLAHSHRHNLPTIIQKLLTTKVSSTLVGIATRWHKFKGVYCMDLGGLCGSNRQLPRFESINKRWKTMEAALVSTAAVLVLGLAAYLLYLMGGMKNDSR
jgi:hypothetical protein